MGRRCTDDMQMFCVAAMMDRRRRRRARIATFRQRLVRYCYIRLLAYIYPEASRSSSTGVGSDIKPALSYEQDVIHYLLIKVVFKMD